VRGLLTVLTPAPAEPVAAGFDQAGFDQAGFDQAGFDPDRRWRLHPQVAVRPERFGALLYHFGTRKLSFLKDRAILAVVESLADHPDIRSACRAAGIDDARQAPYLQALGVLARSNMLLPGDSQ
jgi:putative mycofactocin binding protein MftB